MTRTTRRSIQGANLCQCPAPPTRTSEGSLRVSAKNKPSVCLACLLPGQASCGKQAYASRSAGRHLAAAAMRAARPVAVAAAGTTTRAKLQQLAPPCWGPGASLSSEAAIRQQRSRAQAVMRVALSPAQAGRRERPNVHRAGRPPPTQAVRTLPSKCCAPRQLWRRPRRRVASIRQVMRVGARAWLSTLAVAQGLAARMGRPACAPSSSLVPVAGGRSWPISACRPARPTPTASLGRFAYQPSKATNSRSVFRQHAEAAVTVVAAIAT